MYIGSSSHLTGTNETYLAELYQRWRTESDSVSPDWAQFFESIRDGEVEVLLDFKGASWSPRATAVVNRRDYDHRGLSELLDLEAEDSGSVEGLLKRLIQDRNSSTSGGAGNARQAALDTVRAIMLIRAYRTRGHMAARLDPLELVEREEVRELDPESYGFRLDEWDRQIFINYYLGLESATLREILDICRQTYCGTVGIEFVHIADAVEKSWIQEHVESTRNRKAYTDRGRQAILERLTHADLFETFLDKKYRGTKRFGLDGGESLVPLVEQIFKIGGQHGMEEIVIGMAHRGRLNVLANILKKPYQAIFAEFAGTSSAPDWVPGSGDVKYHMGTSADRDFDGKNIHLSLNPNPSHLEAVNTVVLGKVRAKQRQRGDTDRSRVMGLLLHGDAAFIGQGIVAETFLLSQLNGYCTGGTIHIAINNQIGFTTSPAHSRSSPYCSDMAKTVEAPVFHVNGDDPEACVHVARLAAEYRQRFKKDVVIDMWCYRRHGHNEGDEPMFTQPRMYKRIAETPRTRERYANRLVEEGVMTRDAVEKMAGDFESELEAAFKAAAAYKPNKADWLEGRWSGISHASESGKEHRGDTSVEMSLLMEVGEAISQVPSSFNINSKIARQLKAKRAAIESGQGIDWGTAEALAYGTLLCESTSIRLSGEDSQRGTFSHRHSVLIDQETEEEYVPLNHIRTGQAPYEVIDSPLSEFGLLGFEYGFASAEPHALVVWEAQFGDFANGAQVIIDQFIASAETKWLRMCGLVMLLPHGYEGQGPEHSSARLERYLQLSAEDNWQIVNCTDPANFFHALRRQVRRTFRKPLIVMTPKSLLRHKECVSKLEQFGPGSSFHRVLPDSLEGTDSLKPDAKIRRVVICSGKVYFDLLNFRRSKKVDDVYILRLEQLYPFPDDALSEFLSRFPTADVVWCQEESENSGARMWIDRKLCSVLASIEHQGNQEPWFSSRNEGASPATGSAKRHEEEQKYLVEQAFFGKFGRGGKSARKKAGKSTS